MWTLELLFFFWGGGRGSLDGGVSSGPAVGFTSTSPFHVDLVGLLLDTGHSRPAGVEPPGQRRLRCGGSPGAAG